MFATFVHMCVNVSVHSWYMFMNTSVNACNKPKPSYSVGKMSLCTGAD